MLAEHEAQQTADGEDELAAVDVPDMGNLPADAQQAMQQATQGGGVGGGTPADHSDRVHPHLQQYNTVVHVGDDDDDGGDGDG